MNKQWQEKFYTALGHILAKRAEEIGSTISKVAHASGQQHNTVKRIFDGRNFMFHHAVWITQELNISIDDVIQQMAKLTRAEPKYTIMERRNEIKAKRTLKDPESIVSDLI